MNAYETTATIDNDGQLHLAGVPFAPGSEVEVRIQPKAGTSAVVTTADDFAVTAARERMRELFGVIHGFRNCPRIPREKLYERGSLR